MHSELPALPRLATAEASLDRLFTMDRVPAFNGGGPIRFPDHADILVGFIGCPETPLLIVDPLSAFLPPDRSLLDFAFLTTVLTALARLARQSVATVLSVVPDDLLTRLLAPRGAAIPPSVSTILRVLHDPADPSRERRLLTCPLARFAPEPPPIPFLIEPSLAAPRLDWLDPLPFDLSLLDSAATPGPTWTSPVTEAAEFLRAALAPGPLDAAAILSSSRHAGITRATLFRARLILGIRSRKHGRRWVWHLPEHAAAPASRSPQDVQPLDLPADSYYAADPISRFDCFPDRPIGQE